MNITVKLLDKIIDEINYHIKDYSKYPGTQSYCRGLMDIQQYIIREKETLLGKKSVDFEDVHEPDAFDYDNMNNENF